MITRFAALAALSLFATSAQAATVDFATNFGAALTEGTEITDFDFGNGLTGRLTVTGGAREARIFDTTPGSVGTTSAKQGGGGDEDLASPFTNIDNASDKRSFGNALIIQESARKASAIPDDNAGRGTITFAFDRKIDLFSLTYLDGEKGAVVQVDGNRVGGVARGADNLFDVLTFDEDAARGIDGFTVVFRGSGAIGAFEAAPAPVPLPAGAALLVTALAALAVAKRRRSA
ncbi:MAG: VPLPA-CTERM sorting domain-containing protein [Pseudomonadota bacterium]